MSSSLARTKRRIASIGNTRKLTRAMELIAMAKLRKGMDSLASRRLYLGEWRKALSLVKRQMAGDREEEAKPENGGRGHRLVIAVYSDLGLCGSYNGDMDALLAREVAEGDRLIVVGAKGDRLLRGGSYRGEEGFPPLSLRPKGDELYRFALHLKKEIDRGAISKAFLAATHYVNSLRNEARFEAIYPFDVEEPPFPWESYAPPELDMDPRELYERLVPDYLASFLSERIEEAALSEQSARRTAMETATDNADELLDELELAYNKARQGSITQEIVEVVSGTID